MYLIFKIVSTHAKYIFKYVDIADYGSKQRDQLSQTRLKDPRQIIRIDDMLTINV